MHNIIYIYIGFASIESTLIPQLKNILQLIACRNFPKRMPQRRDSRSFTKIYDQH